MIVSVPEVTPVTDPADTVALLLLALHTPPDGVDVKVTGEPVHAVVAPEIVRPTGTPLTVTTCVAVAVPHDPEAIYFIVSIPKDIPFTTPPVVTVAWLLLEFHVPPVAASVKVMLSPEHTVEAPVIVPALAGVPMVMTWLSADVPQLLVIL